MQLSFHGAARTVTGSKHLITLKNGKKILLDCGLFQGLGKDTTTYNMAFGFEPKEIDVLILSHAHIDHSGLIPKLIKEGFHGKIVATSATVDLAKILLENSATIQESDIKFVNKIRTKQGKPPVEPLYSRDDAKATFKHFEKISYDKWISVLPELQLMFTDAGHIIGSASVHLRIQENGETKQLTFSGDVGRYRDIILQSPKKFPQADYIILESTYGNTLHETPSDATAKKIADVLYDWVEKTCIYKKGKLIIPAFSVGRTQELLYFFNLLSLKGKLKNIPIYIDSPLAEEATAVVKSHPENFNTDIQKLLKIDDDPFEFKEAKFIASVEESKRLNMDTRPMVIIASSGMADAGRVKHHIRNNISNAKNTVLIVGYCEPYSLGGRLKNGEKEVRIFGERFVVKAEVGVMKSMSAHADYDDLCQYLSCQQPQLVKTLFLVHGEYEVQEAFRKKLMKKGFNDVQIPQMHETFFIA